MSSGEKRVKRSITTHEKTSSTGSKKVFDPELQSFTKRIRRFESSIHHDSSKHEKLTIERLCEKIMIALDHYYSDDESDFYSNCKQFLSRGIDSWKQKIVDRMNTYEYVEMAIAHKPFTDIQSEIIKQWKKNYLLFAIMTFWYSSVQKSQLISLKQFKKKYQTCRDFVAQISYLIFKSWLNNWEKRMEKHHVSALSKLFDETSHFIITQSSEFKRVYQKTMLPLIDRQFIGTTINWQYDLQQLSTKQCVFDLQREENLPKTIQALRKFSKQMKLSKKLQLLRQYRMTLQQEINSQQQEIQQRQGHVHSQVLEKDDFISALVYCTIKGHLQQLRYSLLFMVTLMGEQLSILSKLKIKVYFDDLLAVNDFLTVHKLSQAQQKQLQMLQNLAINRRMKIVSSPLLQNSEFEDVMMQHKQLQAVKKNLTQVQNGLSTVLLSSPNLMQC